MLTKAQTQPIRDMLQAAQWHFAVDEKRQGSQKIWEATAAALGLIANERGWAGKTDDDHWDIIDRLTDECSDPEDTWLDAGYGVALDLQNYGGGGFAEGYEFILSVPSGIEFVQELLEIAEQSA